MARKIDFVQNQPQKWPVLAARNLCFLTLGGPVGQTSGIWSTLGAPLKSLWYKAWNKLCGWMISGIDNERAIDRQIKVWVNHSPADSLNSRDACASKNHPVWFYPMLHSLLPWLYQLVESDMELALRQGCCIQWRPSGCISAPPLLYSTPIYPLVLLCSLQNPIFQYQYLYQYQYQYLGTHLQVLCVYAHCALRLYSCNSYMFTLREDLPKKVLVKQNSAK